MKPILACDVNLDKLKFPVCALPKIDGVRGLNLNGDQIGRSGKPFANKLVIREYGNECLSGLDGEHVVHEVTGKTVCAETTSALSTIEGAISVKWCLFDYVVEGFNNSTGYAERYAQLQEKVKIICKENPFYADRLWVVPMVMLNSVEEVLEYDRENVSAGYEGTILRSPTGRYKFGRATQNEQIYLRLKGFMDSEILVTGIEEGTQNTNELTRTPNGYAERSTHKDNMIPNGKVGALIGTALNDVEFNNVVIIKKNDVIKIGAGKMSHSEREYYFNNQGELIGKIAKFQFFPIGIKDKPRFPTFQAIRSPIDL